ncbi:MAG: hypothetical protein AAF266_01635 [Planctomycetota bacterium]
MNDSPKPAEDNTSEWDACDPGTLSGLGVRLQRDHARRSQKRLAGSALAVAAAAVLAFAIWPAGPGVPGSKGMKALPGGIACERCLELMPAYHDQLVSAETNAAADLSAADAAAVAAHIEGCPLCREHFKETYPGALAAATAGLGLLGFATRRFARV